MEKKVIRVGSVGVGAIWGGVHEPGIAKSPDLTLVAICDIDEKKLEAVGEKYGIPPQYRFTDYRDLVNCDIVDAVDICTSNDAHFKVAMAAVEAGKPFNLEKPITLTARKQTYWPRRLRRRMSRIWCASPTDSRLLPATPRI